MKSTPSNKRVKRYASEDRQFWENHLAAFLASGINRRVYCQQHDVDYDRFAYWIKRLKSESARIRKHPSLAGIPSTALLPVQLKTQPSPLSTTCYSVAALATMNLKNGHVLQIHNERALLAILERCA